MTAKRKTEEAPKETEKISRLKALLKAGEEKRKAIIEGRYTETVLDETEDERFQRVFEDRSAWR